MNVAFVGCGFVFDIYMRTVKAHPELVIKGIYDIRPARLLQVAKYYNLRAYESYEALLSDPDVEIVVNLTTIGSHFEVSQEALMAGKHVYSEKPLTKSLDQSRELFALAAKHNVRLCGAPSNIYSDTVRTLFRAVEEGAIGKPLLIYAELDDNPIHIMNFEGVKSPSGAPWPIVEEIYEGCTYEHVGYHLVWICGLLGPAISVTAFSSELIESKSPACPGFVGTPDYSVACLHFANGATARITCSVVAPRDHRMRIIGDSGELVADSYRHYQSPVTLEKFRKSNLSARKINSLRSRPMLGKLFGIGGRPLNLLRNWKSVAVERDNQNQSSLKQKAFEWVRRREVYAQDKFIGIAEMARELVGNEQAYLTPDFILHINELTLLIQGAGSSGIAVKPQTSFRSLGPIPGNIGETGVRSASKPRLLQRLISR